MTVLPNDLYGEEKDYYQALITVAKRHGKFNDDNQVWVGYIPAEQNTKLSIGVACKNCAFYLGNGDCKIVDKNHYSIEDNGVCRLAAIPYQLINKDVSWGGKFAPTKNI
jgi:hypothetical protein